MFQVTVEFIDYGNQGLVAYDKIFEAGPLDVVLGSLPQLVRGA